MNRLGNTVRAAVAFVLPVAVATALATVPTTVPVMNVAEPTCCTGTPWGEIGHAPPPPPEI